MTTKHRNEKTHTHTHSHKTCDRVPLITSFASDKLCILCGPQEWRSLLKFGVRKTRTACSRIFYPHAPESRSILGKWKQEKLDLPWNLRSFNDVLFPGPQYKYRFARARAR